MSVKINLSDFTCLVTGGTKGIGRATVELLCQSKAKVYTCSRTKNELNDFIETSRTKKGYQLYGTTCDIIKAKDRENLIKEVNEEFDGKLDIIVNNVGRAFVKETLDHTDEDFKSVIDTNLEATFKLTKMVYPMLKASDKGGSIIFTSSISGLPKVANISSVYGMTKAATIQLTSHLASEWAKDNIRVNCVVPGFVKTPLTEQIFSVKENYEEIVRQTPMKRPGEPSEIAYAIVFLSSPASSFTTGSAFIVDGGYCRKGIFF